MQTQNVSKYTAKMTPENSVLVMVDYLTGFLPGIRTIDRETYDKNVTALARIGEIFKDRMPTIILGDEGGFRGEFFPQIRRHLGHGRFVERNQPSAWHAAEFRELLAEYARPKIILAGISLDNCVLQTSLDVLGAGYEVYVVVDVSGTDSALAETAAMLRLTQAGAVMTNWVSLASELMDDWATPEGPQIGALYRDYSAWGGADDAQAQSANR